MSIVPEGFPNPRLFLIGLVNPNAGLFRLKVNGKVYGKNVKDCGNRCRGSYLHVWPAAGSAIKKAAAPITSGISCPREDATASTAPANSGLKPIFFIKGMVTDPVAKTFAVPLPLMQPNRALPKTAAFAGPPLALPVKAIATLVKNSLPPAS